MIIVVDYFYDFCSDKIMKIDILTLLCSMENIQNLGTYLETIFKNVFLKSSTPIQYIPYFIYMFCNKGSQRARPIAFKT